MKRKNGKFLITLLMVSFILSCDLITLPIFDGVYDCTTVSDFDTSELELALDDFTITIEMQVMEVEIDGLPYTGGTGSEYKVDSSGHFNIELNINLLLTEVDVTLVGDVSEDGSISGKIVERQSVLMLDMVDRTGTFSGSTN